MARVDRYRFKRLLALETAINEANGALASARRGVALIVKRYAKAWKQVQRAGASYDKTRGTDQEAFEWSQQWLNSVAPGELADALAGELQSRREEWIEHRDEVHKELGRVRRRKGAK